MERSTALDICTEIQRSWNVTWSAGGQTEWLDAITQMDEQHARQALLRFRPIEGRRPGLPEFRTLVRAQASREADDTRPRRDLKLDPDTIERGRDHIARIRQQLGVST